MSAEIISGKEIAGKIREKIKIKLERLGLRPGLAVVQVGEDPASTTYVNLKRKDCQAVGIYSEKLHFSEDTTQDELLNAINDLNNRSDIHGILVQLPLPEGIDSHLIINAVSSKKDVDGFHINNLGELLSGKERLVPCTPKGIIHLIQSYCKDISGKKVVVVGRSVIVGKPTALMLLNRHAVVTVCHSRTLDLGMETRMADILISAVGKPNLITADMVKPGAIVIDVGTNRVNGKLVGDVEFEAVKNVAAALTPVPGGVGPMTRAMLLENTVLASSGE